MNLQAIADPDGNLLWISGAIRDSIHDTAAARIWQIPRLLRESGLFALGDKGYQGLERSGGHATLAQVGEGEQCLRTGIENAPPGTDRLAVGADEARHAVQGRGGQGQRGRVEQHESSWWRTRLR